MSTHSSKITKNKKKAIRVTAPIVLVAFFVYGVSPLTVQGSEKICKPTPDTATNGGWGWDGEKGCRVDSQSEEKNIKLVPPTTINNKTEEIENYDQFNNEIPKVIPVDTTQDKGENKCKPTADSATNGGWGRDGEKGCKLDAESSVIERKVSPDFPRRLSHKAEGGVGKKGGIEGI